MKYISHISAREEDIMVKAFIIHSNQHTFKKITNLSYPSNQLFPFPTNQQIRTWIKPPIHLTKPLSTVVYSHTNRGLEGKMNGFGNNFCES